MLSGLKVAHKLFPSGLITGTVPVTVTPMKKGAVRERASQAEFSMEDIETLNNQLDNALDDRSIGSKFRVDNLKGIPHKFGFECKGNTSPIFPCLVEHVLKKKFQAYCNSISLAVHCMVLCQM